MSSSGTRSTSESGLASPRPRYLAAASAAGAGRDRRRRRPTVRAAELLLLFLQAEHDRPDRELVSRMKLRFFQQSPVDPHTVSAAEITNQHTIIRRRHTAVATRNLGRIDANIAFRVPADQKDRPKERDRGGSSLYEWDDAE